jgi:hypothetical protein
MYWKNQEKIVFDIVLFLLMLFQATTIFVVKSGSDIPEDFAILLALNLFFLAGMISYAKWVWKTSSYQKAFFQVLKHESIVLGASAFVAILVIFIEIIKRHA